MGIISDIVGALVGDSGQSRPSQATCHSVDNPVLFFFLNVNDFLDHVYDPKGENRQENMVKNDVKTASNYMH